MRRRIRDVKEGRAQRCPPPYLDGRTRGIGPRAGYPGRADLGAVRKPRSQLGYLHHKPVLGNLLLVTGLGKQRKRLSGSRIDLIAG